MEVWKPIETAPKNGEEFLATGFDYGEKGNNRHVVVCKHDGCNFIDQNGDVLSYLDYWCNIPKIPKT